MAPQIRTRFLHRSVRSFPVRVAVAFCLRHENARLDLWASGAAIAAISIAAIVAFSKWEEWLNLLLGLWLIGSPWVLGFTHTRAMHVSIGSARWLRSWQRWNCGWSILSRNTVRADAAGRLPGASVIKYLDKGIERSCPSGSWVADCNFARRGESLAVMINSAIVRIVDFCARYRRTVVAAGTLLMIGAAAFALRGSPSTPMWKG